MLSNLRDILKIAEAAHCAIPAFNVYNMETVMGVAEAAEDAKSPVIFQIYSRLFENGEGDYLAPLIRAAIDKLSVPAALHLDHGTGDLAVTRALRLGATGIMRDASALPFSENLAETRRVAQTCDAVGVPVEGELGHVGTTRDAEMETYTDPDEAAAFCKETGIAALAILVGTAHGRYKQAPVLDIARIHKIREATGLPLVLHGGSGVPADQLRAAIDAGIRKVNFGTDLCYAFLDKVNTVSRDIVGIDLYMREPVAEVKAFALSRFELLGAVNCYG